MLTPAQEAALLAATTRGLDDELRRAFDSILQRIRDGEAPRDAVTAALATFPRAQAELMAEALSAILARSVGVESVLRLPVGVGGVTLSAHLYADVERTSITVAEIVRRHAAGWQSARDLTLELFEGYGFKRREVLKISRRNPLLPQHLRGELLTDPGIAGELARHFARVRASNMRTPALRQSYLDALAEMEQGAGTAALQRKLRIAGYEKMRYNAARIAQTELHRAYALRQAIEYREEAELEFVQVRMSRTHPEPDICDYHASVDRYGLGKGVYPKHLAPVPPFHPHCRCILAPRIDIDEDERWRDNPDAGRAWLAQQDAHFAARVAGSRDARDAVLNGKADLVELTDQRQKVARYRSKRVGEVDEGELEQYGGQ